MGEAKPQALNAKKPRTRRPAAAWLERIQLLRLFPALMELRQDVLEFGGNRQAKVGGVLQYGNALIAQVEENDGGAQRAGVRSSKHLRVQDMP